MEKLRLSIAIVMDSVPNNLANKFVIPYSGFPVFVVLMIKSSELNWIPEYSERYNISVLLIYFIISHFTLYFLIRNSNNKLMRKYNKLNNMTKPKAWSIYILSWFLYNFIIVGFMLLFF